MVEDQFQGMNLGHQITPVDMETSFDAPPSIEQIMLRLAVLWLRNTYTNIPYDYQVGDTLPTRSPDSFYAEAPPEYVSPYPNPAYWPQIEWPVLSDGRRWPTWREFWRGLNPIWPPVWPLPVNKNWPYPFPFPLSPSSKKAWSPSVPLSVPQPAQYTPLQPISPLLPAVQFGTQLISMPQPISSSYEELCCIGFNPETSTLDAIFSIKDQSGYGGELCTDGSFESVGFWLVEPSTSRPYPTPWQPGTQFIGEASIQVYDIQRKIQAPNGWLRYAISIPLPPRMSQYVKSCGSPTADNPRIPRLHCVLGWNQKINASNY
ncbi:MAG: hypothetical protein ABI876_06845, partial [Bacteroidota bacterium]